MIQSLLISRCTFIDGPGHMQYVESRVAHRPLTSELPNVDIGPFSNLLLPAPQHATASKTPSICAKNLLASRSSPPDLKNEVASAGNRTCCTLSIRFATTTRSFHNVPEAAPLSPIGLGRCNVTSTPLRQRWWRISLVSACRANIAEKKARGWLRSGTVSASAFGSSTDCPGL